jgi:YD repeat-containing protein
MIKNLLAVLVLTVAVSAQAAPGDPAPLPVPPLPVPHDPNAPCGNPWQGCRRRMIEVITGVNLAQVEVDGGVRFGNRGVDGAVRVRIEGVDVDDVFGDARILPIEAIYVPGERGMRLRVSLAESDVLFFCSAESDGSLQAPVAGHFFHGCRPTGVIGVGGRITEVQWDTEAQRVAARWAEINFVVNLLGNGNAAEYLNRRLTAFLGMSADSIFPGPNDPIGTDSRHMARMNLGITGMFRTDDNNWEFRGYAGYRPNVAAWDDYAIEVRASVLRNLLLGDRVVGSIGAEASYTRWSVPGNSMGAFTSLTDTDTGFIGLIFGLRWH